MYSLLLAIIYLAFISLGLPDALLGAAWPSMYLQFGVPVSYAGAVSMIIAAGTVISSLMSDRLTRRLGAGRVTAFSVLMTAAVRSATGSAKNADPPLPVSAGMMKSARVKTALRSSDRGSETWLQPRAVNVSTVLYWNESGMIAAVKTLR